MKLAEKDRLRKEAEETEIKLDRAGKLVTGLFVFNPKHLTEFKKINNWLYEFIVILDIFLLDFICQNY